MWRKKAIEEMLVDDLCALVPGDEDGTEEPATVTQRLARATRRAAVVVAIDWGAILVLFLLRVEGVPWLELGPTENSVFTLGILAVAVHSGYRLGQLEKLRRVKRLIDDLEHRAAGD